jgi:hypothetical protein
MPRIFYEIEDEKELKCFNLLINILWINILFQQLLKLKLKLQNEKTLTS